MKACTCGKQLADDAAVCPNCGHRLAPRMGLVIGLGLALSACLFIYTCASIPDDSPRKTVFNDNPNQDAAARLARGCNDFLKTLPATGVSRDLDHRRILVNFGFSLLSYEHQEQLALHFACDRPEINAYTLIDKATGRTVGEFSRGALTLIKPHK